MRTIAVACALALLLVLPAATAHGAAPDRDMEERLLHDCVDDYFGGDSNTQGKPGHDIHSLDVQEAWTNALGDHLVFRTIVTGHDDATIRLALQADGASKSFDWTRSGGMWGGTFAKVTHIPDIGDGERFALEGIVTRSSLGIGVGDKITAYTLTGRSGDSTFDQVPGDDTGPLKECEDNFQRPDYTLKGPVQYVSSVFEQDAVSVPAGQEVFVTLTIKNSLRDAAQTVEVAIAGDDVRLHDPATNKYVAKATFDLNKRTQGGDTASIHVAVSADSPRTGTATVTITSSLGGRITDNLEYTITSGTTSSSTTSSTTTADPGEESPAVALPLLLVVLAALALRRR